MKTLRRATMGDMRDIFEWNNHPLSRKNSFRSGPISWDEHERWFAERLGDDLTTIYILCSDDKKLGSARFEEKQSSIRISIMLNPDYFGKRLGSELIRLATEKYIHEKRPEKQIIAEVKGDNLPSKKSFLRAGFEEEYTVYVYGKGTGTDE